MKKPYKIVSGASTPNSRELADWLAKDGQLLIPLVELLEKGERAIDEVIDVMGRATIEAVLQMSAAQVAGPKEQGRRDADREVYWHGVQAGRVALKERQLQVDKPRLRKKRRRADEPGEVEIPAYTALQADQRLADRMLELVLRGVSTRKYETVLPAMADQVGVSKSEVCLGRSGASSGGSAPGRAAVGTPATVDKNDTEWKTSCHRSARRCGSWPCATTTVRSVRSSGWSPPAARSEYRGCPPTTIGQRGTPTRCRRRSSTSRKRRTATVEPQVNDRPDQRSVLGPRRFWRAARRFRRWPSQSRSHSTGSGRRGRATAGQRRLYPFRQSPFPGRLDTGPSTVRVPRIRRRGVGPSRGTSVVRSRRIARRSRSRARSANVREQVPFGPAVSAAIEPLASGGNAAVGGDPQ